MKSSPVFSDTKLHLKEDWAVTTEFFKEKFTKRNDLFNQACLYTVGKWIIKDNNSRIHVLEIDSEKKIRQ